MGVLLLVGVNRTLFRRLANHDDDDAVLVVDGEGDDDEALRRWNRGVLGMMID